MVMIRGFKVVVIRGVNKLFGFLLNMLGGKILGIAISVALFFISTIFGTVLADNIDPGKGEYTLIFPVLMLLPLVLCGRFAFLSLFSTSLDNSLYLMRELVVKIFLWIFTIGLAVIMSQLTGKSIWSYILCGLYIFTIAPFPRLSDQILVVQWAQVLQSEKK